MESEVARATVTIDAVKAMDQIEALIEILKTANSLAGELAETLKKLELKIEV